MSEERLRLAAHCSHRGSWLAATDKSLPEPRPGEIPDVGGVNGEWGRFVAWLWVFESFGKHVCARVALVLATEDVLESGARPEADRAILALEDWVLCPSAEHARAAEAARSDCMAAQEASGYVSASYSDSFPFFMQLFNEESPEREERLFSLICAELAPWALGYSDPVRERVEARQQEAAD